MKVVVACFAYNEGEKIQRTITRHPGDRSYDLLVMDDGSTDGALADTPSDVIVLRNATNRGVGDSMKRVFAFCLEGGYDVIVIQAGNDKDDPREIPRLLAPILAGEADVVQGSRYLEGGAHGNMPAYRMVATRFAHPWLFSLVTGRRVTDTTNGFRAIRTTVLRDPRIDWTQPWLSRYELEPYLLYKAITLGYRYREAPVTKVYPRRELGYTKMRPVTDWWSILRPLVYLRLGLRR
ncbi:MAG: glycosyltransferase family 2 protein [Candidatus Rokubacteria bacterium]|nr:glycosyltransferase family 2 protein [Candidatus Rokubacteria bacterium]